MIINKLFLRLINNPNVLNYKLTVEKMFPPIIGTQSLSLLGTIVIPMRETLFMKLKKFHNLTMEK